MNQRYKKSGLGRGSRNSHQGRSLASQSTKKLSKNSTTPSMGKRVAFIPDLHVPYHDKQAWSLVLRILQDYRPEILVCLGDLGDFYKVSNFSKSPDREHSFKSEIQACNDVLDQMDALGADRKIFLEGNHEHRFARWLADTAPELFGLVSVPDLFHLDEREWEHVPYKSSLQLGKLWITHDVGTAGRYSIFRAADTFQHPLAMAHTHRLIYMVEGNATGETFPAVQFGWLGDIEKVDYMHKVSAKRQWSLGFGTGVLREDGCVFLQPHPLIRTNGELWTVVDGKEYTG